MKTIPLAEKLRPQTIDKVVGQDHLLGENGLIYQAIHSQNPLSIILWGPPGCGKTSIARLYARAFNRKFVAISAIFSGVTELKKIIQEALDIDLFNQGIVLFVDEIHRFNKLQQDTFLPFVENGTLILIGATAENPSFHLNSALLSRMRVLPLYPLDTLALEQLIQHYEEKFSPLHLTPEARHLLLKYAQGDGRYLFNLIENFCHIKEDSLIDEKRLSQLLQKKSALYDKAEDQHYHLISALHKSIRGSDPDAALYWLARMLDGGEDPLYIVRRLIRLAVEDVGLADPQALSLALSVREAYTILGSPEGELGLAQLTIYLALAPKSNAVYAAYNLCRQAASTTGHLAPPKHSVNSASSVMTEMGYGEGYRYDHNEKEGFSGQNYFPLGLERQEFYSPVERGFEREMKKRVDYFKALRLQKNNPFP